MKSTTTIKTFLLIILLSLIPFFKNKEKFLNKTDINQYAQMYANSQYVKGEAAPAKISDSDLYIYAGYAYAKGEDPTTINFEHPPLIKYLFGLSYFVFGNSLTINLIIYPVFLYSIYLVSTLVLKKEKSRHLALIFVGIQPLINSLMGYALLDLEMNIFILFFLYLLLQNKIAKTKKYTLLGLLLGLISSVKYPIPFIFLPILLMLWLSFKKKEVKYLPVSFLLMSIIYIVQYWNYFSHGHNFIDFLLFEKYRFSWWTGDRTMPKFLIFSNLFTGKYKAWWTNDLIMTTKEWNIFLPITFIFYLISIIFYKKKKTELIIYFYSLLLILLYAFGSAAALRYLSQIFPLWVILVFAGIESFISLEKNK